MYRWVVFLHILGALGFFTMHGVSVIMAFQLRRERNPDRIRALLDLSSSSLGGMMGFLLLLVIAGIVAGFMGNWWAFGWIWVALILMIAITVWMSLYSRQHYVPLRKAAGLPYREGNKEYPAVEPQSTEEIVAIAQATNPQLLALFGFGVPIFILWLMLFKPF